MPNNLMPKRLATIGGKRRSKRLKKKVRDAFLDWIFNATARDERMSTIRKLARKFQEVESQTLVQESEHAACRTKGAM